MPAIPNYTLGNGQVLVTELSSSPSGIELQTEGYVWATVVDVYETSDKTSAGLVIFIKRSDCVVLKYGSTIYMQVEEAKIAGVEIPPL